MFALLIQRHNHLRYSKFELNKLVPESRKNEKQRMSYPKQSGFSPPVVEPTAPPCEQPVIVQQVFVVQQPGAQPVYVGDNIVQADQPPPYHQIGQQSIQQPLVPQPVIEQPQQPVSAVQGRRKRTTSGNGDPECVKYCCVCCIRGDEICSCICESIFCLLCCPFYVLKCIFD